MTIDKAIEVLTDIARLAHICPSPEREKALQLSIEALNTIETYRQLYPEMASFLLPGETEK